ncbi:hypothetical protein HKX48_000876 [Thoreauomyces humboldtii]|nr:hypothetical protein HKX48_000876 [Thoreauomyces humboldtii]
MSVAAPDTNTPADPSPQCPFGTTGRSAISFNAALRLKWTNELEDLLTKAKGIENEIAIFEKDKSTTDKETKKYRLTVLEGRIETYRQIATRTQELNDMMEDFTVCRLEKFGLMGKQALTFNVPAQGPNSETGSEDDVQESGKKRKRLIDNAVKLLQQLQAITVRPRDGTKYVVRDPYEAWNDPNKAPLRKLGDNVELIAEYLNGDRAVFSESFQRFVGYYRVGFMRQKDPLFKDNLIKQMRLGNKFEPREIKAFNSVCDRMRIAIDAFGWGILTSPILLNTPKAKLIENISDEHMLCAIKRFYNSDAVPAPGATFDPLKHNPTSQYDNLVSDFIREENYLYPMRPADRLRCTDTSATGVKERYEKVRNHLEPKVKKTRADALKKKEEELREEQARAAEELREEQARAAAQARALAAADE